jgi:hypothetical protein
MSNGRKNTEASPEGRLAAVARTLVMKMQNQKQGEPDYADFRDALRPYVEREMLLARITEARHVASDCLTARVKQLAAELLEVNELIAKEDVL